MECFDLDLQFQKSINISNVAILALCIWFFLLLLKVLLDFLTFSIYVEIETIFLIQSFLAHCPTLDSQLTLNWIVCETAGQKLDGLLKTATWKHMHNLRDLFRISCLSFLEIISCLFLIGPKITGYLLLKDWSKNGLLLLAPYLACFNCVPISAEPCWWGYRKMTES